MVKNEFRVTQSAKLVNQIEKKNKKTIMFDENSNGGNKMPNGQPVKLTLKDKRRPTPLDVRLATQRARGEGTVPATNGALSTPDIVNVTVRLIASATDSNFLNCSVPKGFDFEGALETNPLFWPHSLSLSLSPLIIMTRV